MMARTTIPPLHCTAHHHYYYGYRYRQLLQPSSPCGLRSKARHQLTDPGRSWCVGNPHSHDDDGGGAGAVVFLDLVVNSGGQDE
jgi:hypothetical protein